MKKIILLLLSSGSLVSWSQFIETTDFQGISLTNTNPLFGNGLCFVDFDNDGWDDLTLAGKNQQVKFYKNNSGNFDPYFPSFDPALPADEDVKCVLWVDFDNDGDKDFLVAGIWMPLRVYKNLGDMTFADVAGDIGIPAESAQIYGISAGEIDNDGCIDLYVCKYHNHQQVTGYNYSNHVYQNNCDGTFTDVTIATGFGNSIQASFACVWLDYNKDGFQDVYVINDRVNYPNYLFRNDGDGTFTNVTASSGAGVYIEAMSGTCDDYDNDGDLDIYVTNSPFVGNKLLKYNAATGFFNDVALLAGVIANQMCWGAMWIDFDNNGWLDLFVSTQNTTGTGESQRLFYVSDGDGTFHDGIEETGIDGILAATFTCAMADYNQDGYYDFATNNQSPSNAKLWLNQGQEHNWISVSVEGTVSNKDGIGTWIECYSGGNHYTRYTFCGENYMGQNSEREIFGLGDLETIDSLKISWLSGLEEIYYNPEINVHHHYIEGATITGTPAAISYSGDLLLCEGDTIELVAENADSYLWSNGLTTQSIQVFDEGAYSVAVVDSFGFGQNSDTLEIIQLQNPEVLSYIQHVTCNGYSEGSIELDLVNGSIDTISWSNGAHENFIDQLVAAMYFFSLADNNGCLAEGVFEILQPEEIIITIETEDVLCFGEFTGSAEATVTGGLPGYELNWGDANPELLNAGEYSLAVSDQNECLKIQTFSISEPEELELVVATNPEIEGSELGSVEVFISGGIEPYAISWSMSDDDTTQVQDIEAGTYIVQVTDANGCTVEQEFEIAYVLAALTVESERGFTLFPNPAHELLTFKPSGLGQICEIVIFDLEGRLLKCFLIGSGEPEYPLDISSLQPGLYQILAYSENGQVFSERFISE